MPVAGKSSKDRKNTDIIKMDDVGKEAKSFIDKILGDVSKGSATKQIILGSSSGWVTGFLAMRVGKTVALAVGGGIILLQVAHQKGYIKINWDKVNRSLDKVADKVEERLTDQQPSWVDKAERFVDKKLNKAEDVLKKQQKKARHWYSSLIGDETGYQLKEMHIFIVSFAAGIAIGIGSS